MTDSVRRFAHRHRRFPFEQLPQTPRERSLPDTSLSDEFPKRVAVCPTASRLAIRAEENLELGFSADENPTQVPSVSTAWPCELSKKPATDDAALPSLHLNGFRVGELERADRRCRRSLADHDLSRCGGLFEPGRDVDDVAADEGTPVAGAADDNLARVDADPEC